MYITNLGMANRIKDQPAKYLENKHISELKTCQIIAIYVGLLLCVVMLICAYQKQ